MISPPYAPTLTPDLHAWTRQAECAGVDTEIFFPLGKEPTAPALALCRACPVIAECREACDREEKMGTAHLGVYGIRGGETARHRVLRRRHSKGAEVPKPRKRRADFTPEEALDLRVSAISQHTRRKGDCDIWVLSTSKTGNPQLNLHGVSNKSPRAAIWQATHGTPPQGPVVPECGNLRCLNPDHLVYKSKKRRQAHTQKETQE